MNIAYDTLLLEIKITFCTFLALNHIKKKLNESCNKGALSVTCLRRVMESVT